MKILRDTLMSNGKWSIKRLAGFSAFYTATVYAFIPMWFPLFVVHEFVFWGFITFGASAIGMTVWNKKIDQTKPE
jgi:hypothetical protein